MAFHKHPLFRTSPKSSSYGLNRSRAKKGQSFNKSTGDIVLFDIYRRENKLDELSDKFLNALENNEEGLQESSKGVFTPLNSVPVDSEYTKRLEANATEFIPEIDFEW